MTTFASSTFAASTLALGPSAISADSLIKAGLAVVLLIVFAESGLLIGFFLPGDSMLFTMGMLIARDEVSTPLPVAMILIGLAAVAGDQVGYLIGRKAGPALFRRPDSRLFKQEYVEQAEVFFAKNGARSIVLARFVPIVRTFTPVIAGASRMNYRVFTVYNIIGGLLWGCGVTLLGFYLGKIDFIRDNIEAMLVLVVLVSVVPIVFEYLRNRRKRARVTAESAAVGPPVGPMAGSPAGAPAPSQTRHDGLPADGGDEDGWHQGEDQGADPSVTVRLRRGGGGGGGRHSAAHRRETARD
ncbi:VTT domain-containing protein [Frankia sp. AiPs1]|uniref:DedA family protein n=1 Tax=Frankia sp. AiPs1 TaxID=573493 RepID=UPI00204477BE|nr:VTT domain-containing protein [Frankia sp. AiPs1]MCM3922957.1 VTT domain-containing protein [Frankia sp. AiPs1]